VVGLVILGWWGVLVSPVGWLVVWYPRVVVWWSWLSSGGGLVLVPFGNFLLGWLVFRFPGLGSLGINSPPGVGFGLESDQPGMDTMAKFPFPRGVG